MRLRDKVAIITGSTRGIGRATAERFAREGARVIVNGRDRDAGGEIVDLISKAGGTATFVQAELGDEGEVRRLIDGAISNYGRLDVLVNNAAPSELVRHGTDALVAEVTNETWYGIMRVGLDSVFWSCKYALPHMLKAGGGSIINISSAGAHQGTPGLAAYAATKGGVEAFTRTLAAEYASANIRANNVIVGFVLTTDYARERVADPVLGPQMRAMTMTRLGQPEDVANAVLFLASDESAFITASSLWCEGGSLAKTALPRPRVKFPTAGG